MPRLNADNLPEPDADAVQSSARLCDLIRRETAQAGGRLRFDRYMDLALNAPGLGYYRAPLRRFGGEGDFVTAPELSPLFAACLARQVGEILEALGAGEIFEAGAGSGRLCAGLLNALEAGGRLPRRYLILEPGADLRARQRLTLEQEAPGLLSRVSWVDDLPEPGFHGLMLANELLDSLPVRRFRKSNGGLMEACVEPRGERFDWCFETAADEAFQESVDAVESALGAPLPEGYTSELHHARDAWVTTAAGRLARGALLLFDYGYALDEYYHPQRGDGTLACYYRHRLHADPFFHPGLQDISAHVEFTGIARAARAAGLALAGFTTQAEFLMATGLLNACSEAQPGSRAFVELTGQIKRLTLPGEMGELIKVMALSRGVDAPLEGFSGRDHRDRLAL